MTTSGYPRIIKIWHRGEKIADAKIVMEGKDTDVAIGSTILHDPNGNLAIVVRSPSFFESEYYLPASDGAWWKLPVPISAQLQGLHKAQLLFSLREDWTPPGQEKIAKGALIAIPLNGLDVNKLPPIAVLYAPGPRSSIEEVSTGRDAVYASIYDNVVGSIHVFRFGDGKWSDNKLDLPLGGSTHIISTNDYGPEAIFGFESFLKPSTLYADKGDDKPVEIKALPARFDASGLMSEQFEATSKDGTKIPYFVVRAKDTKGPAPTVLYGYGGFEISMNPSYSANFGKLWLTKAASLCSPISAAAASSGRDGTRRR